MNASPFFELPPFAINALRACVCPNCNCRITAADAIGAGIRLDKRQHCFVVEVRCPQCHDEHTVVLPDHKISTHDWPRQFAEMCGYHFQMDRAPSWRWHKMLTLRERQMSLALDMKGCVSSPYLIFGGYRRAGVNGDVPAHLLVRQPRGVLPVHDFILRLESRSRVRIAELPEGDKLRPDEWESFLDIPDGSLFTREGIRWRKLRRFDIEPLVRDRKFIHASLLKRLSRRR